MTTSTGCRFFTLRQFGVRLPGTYMLPSRLAITPSNPRSTVAATSAAPSPMRWTGTIQFGPVSTRPVTSSRRCS